jgi:predicted Zn-dependent protease
MSTGSHLRGKLAISTLALCSLANALHAAPAPQTNPPRPNEDISAIGHRTVGKGVNLYSLEREQKLGEQLNKEVERASRLLDDPVVVEYVNRIVQKIALNSDARLPITIRVIDSDVADGFTMPGGFQYINTGLILQTESEGELAGLLARGVAHTALRSSAILATQGELMQLATIPLTILGPGSWAGYGTYQGLNLALPLTSLKLNRDVQRAADFYGLQYLYKAGYEPESLVRFLERSLPQSTKPKKQSGPFDLYPPLPERLESMNKEIARILPHQDGAIITTAEFQLVQDRLRALKLRGIVGPPAGQGKPMLGKPSDTPPPDPPPLTPNRQQNHL